MGQELAGRLDGLIQHTAGVAAQIQNQSPHLPPMDFPQIGAQVICHIVLKTGNANVRHVRSGQPRPGDIADVNRCPDNRDIAKAMGFWIQDSQFD